MSAWDRYCPSTICGMDLDEAFAYPTIKYVKIRDARLGIAKYFLLFGITLYVGLYEIWYQGGYLESTAVTGAVRFSLQQPTHDSCDPFDVGCKNVFTPTPDLAYCSNSDLEYTGNKYKCEFYENIGAEIVMNMNILVMTRGTEYRQELVCNSSVSDTCPFIYNLTHPPTTSYVTDAGSFTVLIDHNMVTVDGSYAADSTSMDGLLYVEKNSALCKSEASSKKFDQPGSEKTNEAPCYIKPNATSKNQDFFDLGVMLNAANVDLDTINYSGQTYRETGASMALFISYTNYRNWKGASKVTYTYTPKVVSV